MSWRELKGPMSAVFQSGEDTDRELDCMLDLPAPRKPMNSHEEVHELSLLCLMTALWKKLNKKKQNIRFQVLEYWNSCFEKEELSHLHFR